MNEDGYIMLQDNLLHHNTVGVVYRKSPNLTGFPIVVCTAAAIITTCEVICVISDSKFETK